MAEEVIITYNLKQIGGRVIPSLTIQSALPFAKVYTVGEYLKVRFPATRSNIQRFVRFCSRHKQFEKAVSVQKVPAPRRKKRK